MEERNVTMTAALDVDEFRAAIIQRESVRHQAEMREAEGYAEVITAKAERDRVSFAGFRKIDHERWVKARKSATAANLALARQAVQDAREHLAETNPGEALARFRQAEDRHLKAARTVRDHEAALAESKKSGTPDQVIEAMGILDRAHRWAGELEAAMEDARAVSGSAVSEHAEAEADLADAETNLGTWESQARKRVNGEAPVSNTTVRHCGHFMKSDRETWLSLSPEDRGRVNQALAGR